MDAIYFIPISKSGTFTSSNSTDSLLNKISQLVEGIMSKIHAFFDQEPADIKELREMFDLPKGVDIVDMQSPVKNHQVVF